MRRLALLRHAKAAPQGGGDDHGRPLALLGREAAPRVGAWLKASGISPALTLVSDARRTRETFDLLAAAFGGALAMRLEPRIYNATARTLLDLVRATPAKVPALMLVGHNPGLAELAMRLAGGGGDSQAEARLRAGFPTASVAILDFDANAWPDIAHGTGRLASFATPAEMGGGAA